MPRAPRERQVPAGPLCVAHPCGRAGAWSWAAAGSAGPVPPGRSLAMAGSCRFPKPEILTLWDELSTFCFPEKSIRCLCSSAKTFCCLTDRRSALGSACSACVGSRGCLRPPGRAVRERKDGGSASSLPAPAGEANCGRGAGASRARNKPVTARRGTWLQGKGLGPSLCSVAA